LDTLNILMIGDIVGRPGREVLEEVLPALLEEHDIGLCVANGENSAGGSGLTPRVAEKLFAARVDVLTTGDHVFKKREVYPLLRDDPRAIRPANYPASAQGRGMTIVEARDGTRVGVVNVQGRVFMPPVDCPFLAAERCVEALRKETSVILVDFHAEATSEKVAMGWYLDGKVSAVVGTHTHIQTADNTVLPGGTAYITDTGMTGPYHSVIGRAKEPVLHRFLTHMPVRFDVGVGDERLCGVIIRVDPRSGKARSIDRVMQNGRPRDD
jgi:metallophosphoesterase (TIGR00282 family)